MVNGCQMRVLAVLPPVAKLSRGDNGRDREPVFCVTDGGFQTLRETQLTEALVEQVPAADTTRDGPLQWAFTRNSFEAQPGRLIEIPRIRRPPAGIQAEELLIGFGPEDGEQIAADAVAAGLGQAEHGVGRDCRVDAITACFEDIDAGHGCERLARADDAVLTNDGRAITVAATKPVGIE